MSFERESFYMYNVYKVTYCVNPWGLVTLEQNSWECKSHKIYSLKYVFWHKTNQCGSNRNLKLKLFKCYVFVSFDNNK